MIDTPPKTERLIPLKDLLDLARLGQAMRKAQRRYFDGRKNGATHKQLNDFLRWAFDAERRFDEASARAMEREKVPLPGMEMADSG